MPTLLDSYNVAESDSTLYATSIISMGQSFTCPGNYTLTSCKFALKKGGSPTGSIYAKLYAHTGTYGTSSAPTGSVLATSDAYVIGTTSPALTTSYQLIEFTFTGAEQYAMTAGYYVIQLVYNGGDGSNAVLLSIKGTDATHSGNRSYSTDETNWNANVTVDVTFYVYGELYDVTVTINGATVVISGGTITPTLTQTISGAVIKLITGTLLIIKTNYYSWTNKTKNSATWTGKTKNTSTFTNKTKNTSVWTSKIKH